MERLYYVYMLASRATARCMSASRSNLGRRVFEQPGRCGSRLRTDGTYDVKILV